MGPKFPSYSPQKYDSLTRVTYLNVTVDMADPTTTTNNAMGRLSTPEATSKDHTHSSSTQTTTTTSIASTKFSTSEFDLVTDTTSAQLNTVHNATYVTEFDDDISTEFLTAKQVSVDITTPVLTNDAMPTRYGGLLQKVEDQCDAFKNEVQKDCKTYLLNTNFN